jgi:hypothetical protein
MPNGLEAFLQVQAFAAPRGVRTRRPEVEAGSTPATAGQGRLPPRQGGVPQDGPHPTHAGYQLSEAGLSLDFESVLRAQSSSLDRAAAMYRPQSKRS